MVARFSFHAYETVLGWAGEKLGVRFATPIFDGASVAEIDEEITKAGLPKFGHTYLYDGETGDRFDQKELLVSSTSLSYTTWLMIKCMPVLLDHTV